MRSLQVVQPFAGMPDKRHPRVQHQLRRPGERERDMQRPRPMCRGAAHGVPLPITALHPLMQEPCQGKAIDAFCNLPESDDEQSGQCKLIGATVSCVRTCEDVISKDTIHSRAPRNRGRLQTAEASAQLATYASMGSTAT